MRQMAHSERGPSAKPRRSFLRRKGPALALVVVGAVVQVLFGRFGELRCTRSPQDAVACVHRTDLLGVFPLSKRTIQVLQARVNDDGGPDTGYRVELGTPEGIVPLQDTWSGDLGTQEEKARRINAFLAGDERHLRVGLRLHEVAVCLLPSLLWILGVFALRSPRSTDIQDASLTPEDGEAALAPTESRAPLSLALEFTDADLSANRQGRLSGAQRMRCESEIAANRGMSKGAATIILPFYALVMAVCLAFTESGRQFVAELAQDHALAARFAIGMGALALVIGGAIAWSFRRARSPGLLQVRLVQGEAVLNADAGEESWLVRIGKCKFTVSKIVHDSFIAGRSYRVFYVESWPVRRMVSAEEIRGPQGA